MHTHVHTCAHTCTNQIQENFESLKILYYSNACLFQKALWRGKFNHCDLEAMKSMHDLA